MALRYFHKKGEAARVYKESDRFFLKGESIKLYFAYGSNMDPGQMNDRCPGSELLGKARLPGYRFIINSRGVATVIPEASGSVHGVLWDIDDRHESALDRHEGVRYNTYFKKEIALENEEGNVVHALVYIARDTEPGTPREGYMEKIIGAANLHRMPRIYIEELETWLSAER
jgi:gamma-glutamylcyclotransferase (GGCT)/AIG2-like uncharacterized protein YtfP